MSGRVFPFEVAVAPVPPEPRASSCPSAAQHRAPPARLLAAPSAPAGRPCPLSLATKLLSKPSPQRINATFYSYSPAEGQPRSCCGSRCPEGALVPPAPRQTQTGRAPVTSVVSLPPELISCLPWKVRSGIMALFGAQNISRYDALAW